jgi:putative transposase
MKKYLKIKRGLYKQLLYNTNMNDLYKKSNKVCYSCKYHIIWCTKYRRQLLINSIQTKLKYIIQEIIDSNNCEIIEMEIMSDHVHLLLECPPQLGIHKLVKQLKGKSSRLLRQEFSELRTKVPTLWTNSYFVSTVGGAPLNIIKKYIENQKNQ